MRNVCEAWVTFAIEFLRMLAMRKEMSPPCTRPLPSTALHEQSGIPLYGDRNRGSWAPGGKEREKK